MTGKASLIVMLGFSMLFLVVARNFTTVSGQMTDNYVDYFNETTSHNIAISGANMACNKIYVNQNWTAGFSNINMNNGRLDVWVNIIDAVKNTRQVVSRGIYNRDTSTVRVTLSPSKFSKFAYFSESEGASIWWTGKDTVDGPFHTQDYLRAANKPTFLGPGTSTLKGLLYFTNEKTDKPTVSGDFTTGNDIALPTNKVDDFETDAAGGLSFTGKDTVYLVFAEDSLKYRFAYNASYTTVYLPTAAPNGLIFVKNANVRLKGTVKGSYTLGCSATATGRGNIYLDDDIVYKTNPTVNTSSTDLLGICAENNVIITDNAANNSNINIHASIYCEKGSFYAQNYDSRVVSGNINMLGGLIQKTRAGVGTFDSKTGNIKTGFAKKYKYDKRLLIKVPPFFPATDKFEIVAWYE